MLKAAEDIRSRVLQEGSTLASCVTQAELLECKVIQRSPPLPQGSSVEPPWLGLKPKLFLLERGPQVSHAGCHSGNSPAQQEWWREWNPERGEIYTLGRSQKGVSKANVSLLSQETWDSRI